jgi:hypothetical protein
MIRFFSEYYDDHAELLPTLAIGAIKCDACDDDHGVAVSVGWLFWACGIAFVNEEGGL